jgi:hypothetical protein
VSIAVPEFDLVRAVRLCFRRFGNVHAEHGVPAGLLEKLEGRTAAPVFLR